MSKLIRGLAAIALGLVVDLVAAGPLPGPIVDTQWLATKGGPPALPGRQ